MIRRCVDAGARSESEVRAACGAGGTCGSCRPVIDRLIELHHGTQSQSGANGAQG